MQKYLSWSQIWLNFPMDYQHLGYITKIGTVVDGCGMQRIFFNSEISPKSEIKQIKFEKEWFCSFSVAKSEGGKKGKFHMIHILGFHWVAKHIEGWLKICTLFLVFSQIWLNRLMDDGHILLGTILQPVKEREGKKRGKERKVQRVLFC